MAFRCVTLYGARLIGLGSDMKTMEGVQSIRSIVDWLRIHHFGWMQSIPSIERRWFPEQYPAAPRHF
jgi:hypothetical protein